MLHFLEKRASWVYSITSRGLKHINELVKASKKIINFHPFLNSKR